MFFVDVKDYECFFEVKVEFDVFFVMEEFFKVFFVILGNKIDYFEVVFEDEL